MRVIAVTVLCAVILATPVADAQLFHPEIRVPNAEALTAARKMAADLFSKLKEGKSEEIAKWIVVQSGATWNASTKIQQTNDFRSKLDIPTAENNVRQSR